MHPCITWFSQLWGRKQTAKHKQQPVLSSRSTECRRGLSDVMLRNQGWTSVWVVKRDDRPGKSAVTRPQYRRPHNRDSILGSNEDFLPFRKAQTSSGAQERYRGKWDDRPWSKPLTSNWCCGYEFVELYLHNKTRFTVGCTANSVFTYTSM